MSISNSNSNNNNNGNYSSKTLDNLSRWEALDIAYQAQRALDAGLVGTACLILGMGDDLGPMTLEDISDAITVRFTSVCKIAGIPLDGVEE